MKEYRLAAWPELSAPFDRTACRRMLSDMSHRHVSLAQLMVVSGMRRHEVRDFLEMLDARGVISQRESIAADSLFGSLRPLGGWLRRAMSTHHDGR
jgi:hypothetical protein